MDAVQILVLLLLGTFYAAYLIKMLMLKRQGITGNLLGKGNKPKNAVRIELCLRTATLTGAAIQFASVFSPGFICPITVRMPVKITGIVLALIGNLFFTAAIVTMKNNWRAGFDSGQDTSLVTNGVYGFSRNPAFVGFDLLYIGCALAFPNILNLTVMILAVALFHIQIIGEESHLASTFAHEYTRYKSKVRRYL